VSAMGGENDIARAWSEHVEVWWWKNAVGGGRGERLARWSS